MKRLARTFGVFVLSAWLFLPGCEGKLDSSALNALMQRLRPIQPSEMVAMAFDPNDPDRRREGVVLLSEKDWGLQESYLEHYALLLKTDDDPLVRSAAARALGKAGDRTYLPVVANALGDKCACVRWDAAVALDSLAGDAAVDPLRARATEDASADVRASCARALRHYQKIRVVRTLRQCLLDEDFTVRYQAHASLVALAGRDLGYEPESWPDYPFKPAADRPDQRAGRPWWDWFKVVSPARADSRQSALR